MSIDECWSAEQKYQRLQELRKMFADEPDILSPDEQVLMQRILILEREVQVLRGLCEPQALRSTQSHLRGTAI